MSKRHSQPLLTAPKRKQPRPPSNDDDIIEVLSDDDRHALSPQSSPLPQKDVFLPPLAERLRPKTLDDVIGQTSLTVLKDLMSSDLTASLLFYGPSGTGKTTLAKLVAKHYSYRFVSLSARDTKVAEIRTIFTQAKNDLKFNRKTLLFVDEIHAFNKSQQDVFLSIETGFITLVGATTENPSFSINNALLSRMIVLKLNKLSSESLCCIISRAFSHPDGLPRHSSFTPPSSETVTLIANLADGDARTALNLIETASKLCKSKSTIESDDVLNVMTSPLNLFDKSGDHHYNSISAFIKSMRASQTDAALYYLFVMLKGGCDPVFIARRLVIFASEDIGVTDSSLLSLTTSALLVCKNIGMPECEYALAHATISCAEAGKSRAVNDALKKAKDAVEKFPNGSVPLFLRNVVPMLAFGEKKERSRSLDGFFPKGFKEVVGNHKFFE
ncbi:hypothetical protein GEMRC1_007643 [Eukaryota sp. GEM-RC1]